MELKPDCVRELLLKVEKQVDYGKQSSLTNLKLNPSYPIDDYVYTCKKLVEANFLIAQPIKSSVKIFEYQVFELTYGGHQYLEEIRSPQAWKFAKEKATELGSFSLKTLGTIAQGYVENYIKGLF